jgi:uncharacterized protein with HEPN domain
VTEDMDRRYLTYIRDAIDLIEVRSRVGREEFLKSADIQDAILWRLQTLAEATGKLSQTTKDRHPDIRWRAIYGFRNIVAHGYLELNLDRVWEIIEHHLPPLRSAVDDELSS